METNLLISVIIPVYNVEKYIEKCLKSVCEQTYQKLEILVIDDCSVDGSQHICDRYASDDRRIKVFHNSVNQGIAAVRNKGLECASGEYYLFVDGDDSIAPDLCERAVQALNQSVDTIHWGYACVNEAGEILSQERPILKEQEIISQSEIFDRVLNTLLVSLDDLYYWFSHNESYYEAVHSKKQMAAVWRFLLSAEVIRQNELRFPSEINRGEDIVFLLCYLQCSKGIVNINETEYYYLQRLDSLSRDDLNIDNKLKLMEAMDYAVKYASADKQELLRDKWRGQRILITMNTARKLVKMSSFFKGFRQFRKLAAHYDIRDAYMEISLSGIPFKYKVAIGMIKYKLYLLFYLCIYLMNRLHMDMAPMD